MYPRSVKIFKIVADFRSFEGKYESSHIWVVLVCFLGRQKLPNFEYWIVKLQLSPALSMHAYLPCELVNLRDEVVLDDVEGVLGGQQLVVLRDQVLHLLPHA